MKYTCLDSHMNFSHIPSLIHRVYYDVSPLFAAITASTLRLSTKFRCVFLGFFDNSFSGTFVRSHTDVGRGDWLSVSTLIHPKSVLSGWGQDSVQDSQVHPHQTLSFMPLSIYLSLWTLLCALMHSHVGTGRGRPWAGLGPLVPVKGTLNASALTKRFWTIPCSQLCGNSLGMACSY